MSTQTRFLVVALLVVLVVTTLAVQGLLSTAGWDGATGSTRMLAPDGPVYVIAGGPSLMGDCQDATCGL